MKSLNNLIKLTYQMKSSMRNRLGLNKTLLHDVRPCSYPYISGDLFRSISDLIIEDKDGLALFLSEILPNSYCYSNKMVIFASVDIFTNENCEIFITHLRKNKKQYLPKWKLLIHNGDKSPSLSFLNIISDFFEKIYCVNVVEEFKNVIALPIGLENLHYLKNGTTDFYRQFKLSNLINGKALKENLLFSAFNVNTNFSIRSQAAIDIKESRFKNSLTSVPPELYKSKLSKSFFAASPPGNGYDCHRTWESIYLDTIPIVLKGYLSINFIDNLPIMSISSYSEINNVSDEELLCEYERLISRGKFMAYADYWLNEILEG